MSPAEILALLAASPWEQTQREIDDAIDVEVDAAFAKLVAPEPEPPAPVWPGDWSRRPVSEIRLRAVRVNPKEAEAAWRRRMGR